MFLEDINIYVCRPSKEDGPPQCMETSPNPSRAWIEQKGGGRENLPSAWLGTSIFSCPQTLAFLGLGPWDSDWVLHHSPLPRPSPQAFELRLNYTISFPGSPAWRQILELLSLYIMWTNYYNKVVRVIKSCVCMYMYIHIHIASVILNVWHQFMSQLVRISKNAQNV